MTDNERIKLLEACVKFEDCEKCPRYGECEFFYDREYIGIPDVLIFSLDLIKSQKAELERLKKDLDIINAANAELYGAFEENERLKSEIERLKSLERNVYETVEKLANKIKVEARKEFAERLKEEQEFHVDECDRFVGFVAVKRIDNLVKEMENKP